MTTDKKAAVALKLDFDLHVSLIQRQEGVPKAKAQFIAWSEGRSGLDKRLAPAATSLSAKT